MMKHLPDGRRLLRTLLNVLLFGVTLLSGLYAADFLWSIWPFPGEEVELVILLVLAEALNLLTFLRLCRKGWLPGLYAPVLVLLMIVRAWQNADPVPDSSLLDLNRVAAGPVVWAVGVQAVLHLLCSIADRTLTTRRALICLGLTVWTVGYVAACYAGFAVMIGAWVFGSSIEGLACLWGIFALLGLAATVWLHVRGAWAMQPVRKGVNHPT